MSDNNESSPPTCETDQKDLPTKDEEAAMNEAEGLVPKADKLKS